MKIACSSQSFERLIADGSMTLAELFRFCADCPWIEGVELEDKHLPHPGDMAGLEMVRALSEQYQLPVVNVAFFNDFGHDSPDALEAELHRVEEWVRVAQAIQSPRFRLFTGWPQSGDKDRQWNEMVDVFRKASETVVTAGLMAVVENHNHGGFLSSSEDVLRLFQDVSPVMVKLLLDTGNFTDGLEGIRRTAHLAAHVHAKTTHVDENGVDVAVDYELVVSVLKQAGYKNWLSIEYEGDQDPLNIVPKFAQYLHRLVQ
ncbi:MAG: sugar phosphate isomerase/epimerase [Alicyclobacillus sp.]|nr:sugar phosphate isomerase/epimerase [Alicyclobacillus sp.]